AALAGLVVRDRQSVARSQRGDAANRDLVLVGEVTRYRRGPRLAQLLVGDGRTGLIGEALYFDYEALFAIRHRGQFIQLGLRVLVQLGLIQREQYGYGLHHIELVHRDHVLLDHIGALQAAHRGGLCAIGRLLGAVSGALRIIRTLAGALGSLTGRDSLTVGIRHTLFRPREIGRQA